jgi:superfamily II DNA or RNA helicase
MNTPPLYSTSFNDGDVLQQLLRAKNYRKNANAGAPGIKDIADVYIIQGNPDVIAQNKDKYDDFYRQIENYVQTQGLTSAIDPGLPETTPPGGKLWIGHSRGADRLRFAPKGIKTLILDNFEPEESKERQRKAYQKLFSDLGVAQIADVPVQLRPAPGPEHYTFNPQMQAAIAAEAQAIKKQANKGDVLQQLLRAKKYSDQKRYEEKNLILRNLIGQNPQDWYLDDKTSKYYGLTHLPTNFRIHADRSIVPLQAIRQAKPKQKIANNLAPVLSQEEIFKQVRPLIPGKPRLASGGLPDVKGISDVDIGLHTPQYKELLDQLPAGTKARHENTHSYYSIPGYTRDVNVFATSDKNLANRAVRHRAVQLLLLKKYPHLTERARKLKAQGLGTEPAWASVLKLDGDPYEAMLDKKRVLAAAAALLPEQPSIKEKLAALVSGNTQDERGQKLEEIRAILTNYLDQKKLDPEKAVLLAGGAMYAHRMRDDVTDIDFFHPELKKKFKKQVGNYELDGGPGSDMDAAAWDATNVGGLRVQTPQALRAFYGSLNRPKDQEKIKYLDTYLGKQAALKPDIQLQEHQQRIADRLTSGDNRMLLYHGLGSGKSLSAIAAAEAAGGPYTAVAPASLKQNFEKEIDKFTEDSTPEVMSYTGVGMGKTPTVTPQTLILDEAHRIRNPDAKSSRALADKAKNTKNLLLLTGTPITNAPSDLANLLSLLNNKQITPQAFDKKFVGVKKIKPSLLGRLRGRTEGEQLVLKNKKELTRLLKGKVDYQASKTPEGLTVKEKTVRVPLSRSQAKIQKAIKDKIPPEWAWKLNKDFPLSRKELQNLNSFLTGLRQSSLSTLPFRGDKNPLTAFEESEKLKKVLDDLKQTLDTDERKKAIIYSNFIDAGLKPLAAALERDQIPHGLFYGGIPVKQRQKVLEDYNTGKLRALLIGPAAAEGISTKGTSLIQLLDPHWHESRLNQARGRGLRFDSHTGLPEELKNVDVLRYISESKEPSWFQRLMGGSRQRTGDEILESLAARKEELNEQFRDLLREVGSKR